MRTRSNRDVVFRSADHVVWCPKYRRPVIVDDQRGRVDARLKEILAEVCRQSDAELIELETMPDHVHLLVGVDAQSGIHRLVETIKGRSSRLLRSELPSRRSQLLTLRTNSCLVATVGGAPLEVIKQSRSTSPTSATPERSATSPLRGERGSTSPRLKPGASRPTPHSGEGAPHPRRDGAFGRRAPRGALQSPAQTRTQPNRRLADTR